MTTLILIRHCQTDYNLAKRYCGISDPPLNYEGIEQAKRLAARLKGLSMDKVYSSALARAYDTAALIFKNKTIKKSADLREMDFGIFDGLKHEEIIKKRPKLYKNWIDNPLEVRIPGGEKPTQFRSRVRRYFSSILSRHLDEKIAVVTHGGPIRVILCDALGYDMKMFGQIEQSVGALNIIEYSTKSAPVVIKMNDTSHLLNKKARAA